MKIANFTIGDNCFIIAELSANHNQDINLAKKSIKLAKESGANAIKLQTYTPDSMTMDIKSDIFKASDIWSDKYLYDLYKEAYLPIHWHKELFEYAKSIDIIIFSSPFDKNAVDLLEELDTPAYKIASFEITDIPLIKYVASKQKPIIISTGIANFEDIRLAIQTCHEVDNKNIILLKCTSAYPASLEDMNLIMIEDIKKQFNVEVGLSDHTLGIEAPILSIAFGAKIIEKHFMADKKLNTADSSFSLDPVEFRAMVDGIRKAEKLIGNIDYSGRAKTHARSLFISKDIKKGEIATISHIQSIRPGHGLHPKYYEQILNQPILHDKKRGEPIFEDDFI